ncbi:MAG TPA: cytochrome c oxidase subunit II [Bacteroidales bacterium]|jgi:cytochrome c oxidase subunit 2|nr:cytochrome c oxidase subunit II [Bacteroidales bacterium]
MYSTTGFEASNFVSTFNASFDLILWISLIFIFGLTATMLYFAFRYNSKKHKKAEQIEGSTALEITWTVIPVLLALLMFYYGWSGWTPMNKPPKDGMNVTTVARMWSFTFMYDNGKQSPDLVVPVSTPVNLKLTSLDVLHSVFIPEFRIKSDIIPGREKIMWFQSDRTGEYELFCSEYCGLRHSYMNAKVRVLPKDEYDKWYGAEVAADTASAAASPGAAGEAIVKNNGCLACHSTDGSKIVGPTFQGLFGSQQNVAEDGKNVTVTADEQYITRSIYEPDADIVQGFQKGLMQSYKGTISEDDVAKIIEYLKTLNGK